MEERYPRVRVRTIKPTTRGRISISFEFRRELGLVEGSQIEITLENGGITVRPFSVGEEPESVSDNKGSSWPG